MNMNVLFRMIMFVILAFSLVGCSDDEELIVVPELDVNYANLNGTWKLVEWNGQVLPEGVYCYIELDRKAHTFTMYQKFDSMYAKYVTGSYNIEEDIYLGYIIDGEYDYENGDWNNSYIVTAFDESTMVWTAKDNKNDVCKYVRCEEVPQSIKDEARVFE